MIALAKPFQQLLKYRLLFQNLLFRTNLVTFKYEGMLRIVTEIEAIVEGIEDKGIWKGARHRTWDALGRIDGLDKVKQLAVPKPSRVLVEERRIPARPSVSGATGVEGKCSSKQRDASRPESSNRTGEGEDLWLVVFNDVVLRCQRTGTVLLPKYGALWWTTNSTPGMKGRVEPATTARRKPQLTLGNLYKFLKACFAVRITLCGLADQLSRLRRGRPTSLFKHVMEVSRKCLGMSSHF